MIGLYNRRSFLIMGLAAVLASTDGVTLAQAQQARRRTRRQLRRIRRRAIRRYRQRGGLPIDARDAVRRGDVRPLRDVLAMVRRRSNAEVLDVDLYRRPQGWVYEMRLLTAQGRLRDVFLDARSLEPLQIGNGTPRDGVPLPRERAPRRLGPARPPATLPHRRPPIVPRNQRQPR